MLAIEKGTVAIHANSYSFGSGSTPNRDLTINGGSFQLDSSTYVNHVFLTADVIERVWQQEDVMVTVEEVTDLRSWSPAAVTESILSDDGFTQLIQAALPMNGDRKFLRLSLKLQ